MKAIRKLHSFEVFDTWSKAWSRGGATRAPIARTATSLRDHAFDVRRNAPETDSASRARCRLRSCRGEGSSSACDYGPERAAPARSHVTHPEHITSSGNRRWRDRTRYSSPERSRHQSASQPKFVKLDSSRRRGHGSRRRGGKQELTKPPLSMFMSSTLVLHPAPTHSAAVCPRFAPS